MNYRLLNYDSIKIYIISAAVVENIYILNFILGTWE